MSRRFTLPQLRGRTPSLQGLKGEGDGIVTVVIGTDWNHYYANTARTFVVREPGERVRRAIEIKEKALELALQETRVGATLNSVEKKLSDFFREKGFGDSYIAGYTHGVGLLIEELPMPTIVVPTRATKVAENMVLSIIHAPLMISEGAIKHEDTYLVKRGGLERIT